MVMCVCTSMSPGNPVNFDRSIDSAPAGIADASVVTPRIRSPSTITMAFVQSLPLASQSLPKLTALTGLALAFSWAQIPSAHHAARAVARMILIGFTAHSPLHLHAYTPNNVCFLIQLSRKCNREEPRLTAGGGPFEKMAFSAEKKSSLEAWAVQHRRSESQGPIAEGFSHRAFRSDSAHALPGIFSSLQSSQRPTSRSVFP